MPARLIYNPQSGLLPSADPVPDAVLEFHRRLPQYEPSPVREWPGFASELGVGRVWVKDESRRLGTPSFKILGASWAIARTLAQLVPGVFDGELRLKSVGERLPNLTLLAATDGNHGHAVARVARLLGLRSRILVASHVSPARRTAIAAEGADVEVVDGSYDDAVRQSASEADDRHLLISDTSWLGYEDTPRLVIQGYSTILRELDEQLPSLPGLVVTQIGVGAFAAAVARHYRNGSSRDAPRMLGVEPTNAACMMASIAAGRPVEVPGPHDSVMSGLNCGVPSMLAWPVLRIALDAIVAIDDDAALEGVSLLASAGVLAGECAGAAPAALVGLLLGPDASNHRAELEVDQSTDVLLFVTEGATSLAGPHRGAA